MLKIANKHVMKFISLFRCPLFCLPTVVQLQKIMSNLKRANSYTSIDE